MTNKTTKAYWGRIHKKTDKCGALEKKMIQIGTFVFGENIKYFKSYSRYLFNNICNKYLPKNKKLKMIEIGCAPGKYLIELNQHFGYIPFGVEYSKEGIELTKKNFSMAGIDCKNIIYGDFFNHNFQKKYRNYFDIVFSFGFIEHFDKPHDIIAHHINLLKKNGFLVIAIPNLLYFNYLLMLILNPKLIKMHNLKIMNYKNFKNLFSNLSLQCLYCNYYGTINLGLINTERDKKIKRSFSKLLILFQYIALNPFSHFLFKNKGCESKFFSPFLIYIGKKVND